MIEIGAVCLSALFTVIGFLIVHSVGRLEKTISGLSTTITTLSEKIDLSHRRHDIMDVVLSTILRDSFNSDGIAKGKTDWPRIFRQDDFDPHPRSKVKKV